MTTTSKYIDGVPKLPHCDPVLKAYSTCIQPKQKKNAAFGTTLKATVPFQDISIDFSFAGIRSENFKHRRDYLGVHDETCWLLITDLFSIYMFGKTFKSKAVPLQYLCDWLASTVLLETTLDMCASIKVDKYMVEPKYETLLTPRLYYPSYWL